MKGSAREALRSSNMRRINVNVDVRLCILHIDRRRSAPFDFSDIASCCAFNMLVTDPRCRFCSLYVHSLRLHPFGTMMYPVSLMQCHPNCRSEDCSRAINKCYENSKLLFIRSCNILSILKLDSETRANCRSRWRSGFGVHPRQQMPAQLNSNC